MIVACVKVGTKYGPEYVHRLAAMVARHATRPHRFLCLTDDPAGVACEAAPIGTDLPGWWAKLVLFQPHPALAGERILYLDLDTVLAGSIDPLLAYRGDFAILRDFYRPAGYGSAVMAFAAGFGAQIWESFYAAGPENVLTSAHGDQTWIERCVPQADRWQDVCPGLIGSYKADAMQASPKGFAVCCFHGIPKPHEVDGWVQQAWQ